MNKQNPNQNDFAPVLGLLVQGVFWHYAEELEEKMIHERLWREKYRKAMQGFFGILSALCLLTFALLLPLMNTALTWRHPLMLFIWSGLFFVMTAFSYRERSKYKQALLPLIPDFSAEPNALPDIHLVERRREIATAFTKEARRAVDESFLSAKKSHHADFSPLHLFIGMMLSRTMQALLVRLGISYEDLQRPIARQLSLISDGQTVFSPEMHSVMARALQSALKNGRKEIGIPELFSAIYDGSEFLQELFYSLEVDETEMRHVLAWLRIEEELRERYKEFRRLAAFKPVGAMNRAYTSVQTKFLDSVSYDLTRSAVRGHLPMLIGREKEVEEIFRVIEGGRQSAVLIGESGIGKEAIIAGIAERMVEENVPNILKDKRLVELSIPHIIGSEAGTRAQERLLFALQEVARSGNIVLVIQHIDQLSSAQMAGLDLSSILANELDRGYTFVIATTSPARFAQTMEGSILASKLAAIRIEEPSRDEAIRILESKLGGIENRFEVIFTFDALAALVDLSDRYMHEAFLPEKAIHLAEEAAIIVQKRGEKWARVLGNDVEALVSQKTKVNVTRVSQAEGQELLRLEERMHERMIGQGEAVQAIAASLRRARTKLRAENRPIASFLFLGPTGVGKTELAKTTAEVYFGSEEAMARFDMSEYQDQASIARLIGGAHETGLLTEAIRRNPFTVLLLDEIEKAHPDILNLFLQVMEDGRLTDGTGRTIDFTNVILIATSNAGTQFILEETGKGTEVSEIQKVLVNEKLKEYYRPEFLNRFDAILVFKPLSMEDVVSIAYLMIAKVAKRLEAKGINLEITDAAVHELAQKGFDPSFGARPLRRVIQDSVDNRIADFLLTGTIGRRDTVVLDVSGKIEVKKAEGLA